MKHDKYDINELPIVPYIIAERALWNIAEKKYPELAPQSVAALVSDISPVLVLKANILYKHSPHFRSQLNDQRKDMRYTLEMFMEHWSMAILRGYQPVTA
jgi:hypothetical protein